MRQAPVYVGVPHSTHARSESTPRPHKLLARVRETCRARHLSYGTEKSYAGSRIRIVQFHSLRHPETLGAEHVEAFLTYLAAERRVAASTQNRALNAIVFLFRHVLAHPLGDFGGFTRARRPHRLPVVLSPDEVAAVLARLAGVPQLVCWLLYGTGLRLSEALRLRVKDVEFARSLVLPQRSSRRMTLSFAAGSCY